MQTLLIESLSPTWIFFFLWNVDLFLIVDYFPFLEHLDVSFPKNNNNSTT